MSLTDRYRELPRAGRWGVWALAGLAFYFLVVEVAVERWSTWNAQAAAAEAKLRDWMGSSDARKADEATVMNGTRLFGTVSFPGPEAERSQALRSRIADVLKKHGVREYEERGREYLLERGPLGTAIGAGSRVRRIVRDVTFETTPDTMTQILADLERSPEVSTVSTVSARKTTGTGNRGGSSRNLSIKIVVESWGLAREAAPVQPSGGGV